MLEVAKHLPGTLFEMLNHDNASAYISLPDVLTIFKWY